ncbi:MAG: pentapeptide repeat-containing protein [Cyanobacteria bacterium P01_H01_bin.58]
MNRFKIKPLFRRPQQAQDPTQETRAIAERLYCNRQLTKRSGDADSDWAKAERILKSPVRRELFYLNQSLIQGEKWIDRHSTALEVLGVIAIPLVLFFAAQGYQESLRQQELERAQQQAITNYLNQLATILLDLDGSLSEPQNTELRTLTTAITLTLLSDLNGIRKGQVIKFLSRMNLVQGDAVAVPGVSLRGSDLSDAHLRGTELSGANLSFAHLHMANFREANLSFADLRMANFREANLINADFLMANFREANLRRANLLHTDLSSALNLTQSQLEDAYLCKTQLPVSINLDPNRDCVWLWLLKDWAFSR